MRRWSWLLMIGVLVMMGLGWLWQMTAVAETTAVFPTGSVSGIVQGEAGPLAGARVRARATDNLTFTDETGQFALSGLAEGMAVEVTAWADGYYNGYAIVTPTVSSLTLTLRPYHTSDHPDYQWVSPISGTTAEACGNCHPMIMPQWAGNAHGTAVANPRFFALYNGTNISGTAAAGPGYLNDFPATAGVCAGCHAPGAAAAGYAGADGYLTTNMNDVRGQVTAGIHCDYCHKVGGVYLDPATESVYANAPGVYSQRLLRPPAGDQIFFGPFDDIHDPDTYLPLTQESAFCAPCHQFSFWGTPIYESYNEWLASPYAAAGVTCQDCHMPPNGDSYFALPEVGGVARNPDTIPAHLQLGALDEAFLQQAVSLTVGVQPTATFLSVTVTISNTNVGHHIPTDFPGRQMVLVVTAVDDQGAPLAQQSGPIIPMWGGENAGEAGVIYAKLLRDVLTGDYPVVSYWKQTLIASDNRIPALALAQSAYTFARPATRGTITATVWLRRVTADVAAVQGWEVADQMIAEMTVAAVP